MSLQHILHYPDDFIDLVQGLGTHLPPTPDLTAHPFAFPLSPDLYPAASKQRPVGERGKAAYEHASIFDAPSTLLPLNDGAHLTVQNREGLDTPFVYQLRQCFSATNRRENLLAFIQWLKDILVLYEHNIGADLTYVFYPYHPYLLKQVKRFGPIGPFFAEQFAHSPAQMSRTRDALLRLLISKEGQPDYIESLVRPLLLHEYATRLAKLGWQDHSQRLKRRFVVVPFWPMTQEACLYDLFSSAAPRYLGVVDLQETLTNGGEKRAVEQILARCFTLQRGNPIGIAIFTAGTTPQEDALIYFHCDAGAGIHRLSQEYPLVNRVSASHHSSPPLAVAQLTLVPQPAQEYTVGQSASQKTIIRAEAMDIVMEDIERIADLQDVDRFERLKWIDRLLNFHLVLYVLRRGVRTCNCYRPFTSLEEPSTCARFFAVIDCSREFRSDIAALCYNDFAFLRDGVRRNYRTFIAERLGQLRLPNENAGRKVQQTFWVQELRLLAKSFEKFYDQFFLEEAASMGKETTTLQIWTQALFHYFNSSGGDMLRIFEVVNTHGRMIGFIEPTTGRSSRRKLTMTPDLLEVLIHCVAKPHENSINLNEFIDALFDRYGLIVDMGDARWHHRFAHQEDQKRMAGWISALGEQNKTALRAMLRDAGFLLEYSDSHAEVKVHYGREQRTQKGESL
ncbi:MAG: hypothetical protein ACJ8BW_06815 [Ktedonobacteraceae bacterium]